MRSVMILLLALLLVSGAQAQQPTPPFSPDQDYFIAASVDKPTPYVGEQVVYTFRLYGIDSPSDSILNLPDFDGFWIDAGEVPPRSRVELVGGRQYTVIEKDTRLYPARAGDITINPTTYVIPAQGNLVAQTGTVVLRVKPLPDGAPEGFQGAVGQFVEVEARVDRQSLNLGEPVTLSLRILGTGSLEQLLPPDVPVPDTWRLYENEPVISHSQNSLNIEEKTFFWSLIPDQSGTLTIPPLTFAYFDPQTAAYRSIPTNPITLTISPETNISTTPASPIQPTPTSAAPSLKSIVIEVRTRPLYPEPAFWSLWTLPPFVVGAGWLWIRRKRHPQQRNPRKTHQSKALQKALAQLNAAQKSPHSEAYPLIASAIYIYFANKLGCSPEDLEQTDLQKAMTERNVRPTIATRIMTCLELAKGGRYAPVSDQDIILLLNQTAQVLAALDKTWGKR